MGTRYAEIDDLANLAMVRDVVSSLEDAVLNEHLDAASDEASSYLRRAGLVMPLKRWDRVLRMHVCNMAAYHILSREGFNPREGADYIIVENYKAALRWLEGIAAGKVLPDVEDSSVPPSGGGGSSVAGQGPFVLQAREGERGVEYGPPQPRWLGY